MYFGLSSSVGLAGLVVVALLGGFSLLTLATAPDRRRLRPWLACPPLALLAGALFAARPAAAALELAFLALALASLLAIWSERALPRRLGLALLAGALLLPVGVLLIGTATGAAAEGAWVQLVQVSSLLPLTAGALAFAAPAPDPAAGATRALRAAGALLLALACGLTLVALAAPAGAAASEGLALGRLGSLALLPALAGLASLVAQNARLRREAADSAERLRDLVEISSDWLWETDSEHRLTSISPRYAGVSGLDPALVLGMTRMEATGGTAADARWQAHLADLEARRPFSDFVYDLRIPGQPERSCRVSGRPIFDVAGRFTGYRGIGDDVTTIRRAEQAVRRLQGRLQSALVSLDHGFALFDEEERLVVFNQAYQSFAPGLAAVLKPGLSFEEVIGAVWDLGAYSSREPDRAAYVERRLEQHRNAPYEVVQTLDDGTILQISGMPTEEGGRVVLLADITERRQRERVLETLVRRRDDETTLEAIAEATAIASGLPGAGVFRRLEDGRVELAAWSGELAPAPGTPAGFDGPCSRHGEPLETFAGRDAGKVFAGCDPIEASGAAACFCRRLELGDGTVLGYLVALDGQPRDSNPINPDLLNLVARSALLELRRLQSETALRLSEQRFRDIAEINSDWIWESDAEQRYTYLSPRFSSVTGIPLEEVLGKTRMELAGADLSDPLWQAHLADLAAHRDIREFVYSARFADAAQPRRYRITGKALFDEQGAFLGYRGTANDITEIVETRAAAETLRVQLTAAVTALPDGFALFDPDERLVICNEAYRRITPALGAAAVPGASFEAIVRAALADGLFDLSGADPESFVAARLARHRAAPYRIELDYADGRAVQISGARTPDGGSVLLWTDIGVHVRRERVLSILVESRTRGRDLLEAASEALHTGLGFRWAGVARRDEALPGQADVLALWDGKLGEPGATFSYPLAGTPCDRVYNGEPRSFWPRNVAVRFPLDTYLAEQGAEAYLGQLLLDGEGRVLGHIFALHDAPVTARPGDDEIVRLVANAVTIELQRLEAARERDRAAELLRIVFENVGAGITVVDRDLRVIGYNDRFRELLEFPPGLLASGSFEAMVRYNAERGEYGPGDIEDQIRRRLELARRFEGHRFERRRPNGSFLEVRGDPLPGGGFVTTYTDVTERRRIEDALRESELRYRLISEMTSDLLYSFRIEPDGTPVAEWAAGNLGDLCLDLSDHEEPGSAWRACRSLFHPEDQDTLAARDRRMMAGESSIDEVRMLLEGDRLLWVRLHGRPELDPNSGRVVRILGAAQDVTERRQTETELRGAMETAELANRAKNEFLATMSHELRTPLNAIIGFSEIMAQELIGPLGNARYRSYSQDIRDSGTHLLDIINDILDVSKAEAGMLELTEEELDLAATVAASLRLIRPRAERGGVRLVEAVPEGLPSLLADPRRLKQVLLNLLSNAVKFTPAGGLVSVDAWLEGDGGLAVQVTDTGIGIKPEDLQRVLEPFTQVDTGFNRRHEGTGLGLPLTKALVELHGGSLELSRSGQGGTCALIRFPAFRVQPRDDRRPLRSLLTN